MEGRKNRYEDGTPHFANPTRKTRWSDRRGERSGARKSSDGGIDEENRREGEIGTGKNKVG